MPEAVCQFITFQAYDNPITNGLFSEDVPPYHTLGDDMGYGADEKKESPGVRVNENQYGQIMIKYIDYNVCEGAHVKCINASTVSL